MNKVSIGPKKWQNIVIIDGILGLVLLVIVDFSLFYLISVLGSPDMYRIAVIPQLQFVQSALKYYFVVLGLHTVVKILDNVGHL